MSTTILADRYNTLRNQVNLVLGQSTVESPTYGYGQTFNTSGVQGTRSTAITSASKVTAEDYENLYIDLIRVRSHQVGSDVAIQEFVVGDYEINAETTDKVEEAYILGLESLATNITSNRFDVNSGNLDVSPLPISSTRPSSAWSNKIWHIFTITFRTVIERQHWFNAGGQIRFGASVNYTGSQPKSVDWQTILNDMGTISFKAIETVNNAAVGTGSSIGNFDLTSNYQTLYSRDGGAVYANNEYRIYAREYATVDSTSAIQFKVEFIDGSPNDPTYGVDEVVFGTFNSTIEVAVPSSEITINGTVHEAVSIDYAPVAAIIRPLS
jgi:hypothetical protein